MIEGLAYGRRDPTVSINFHHIYICLSSQKLEDRPIFGILMAWKTPHVWWLQSPGWWVNSPISMGWLTTMRCWFLDTSQTWKIPLGCVGPGNLTWLSLGVKQQKRWLIRWDTQIVHPVVQWRFFQPLPMPEIQIQANCTGKSVNQWFDFGKIYRKQCGLTIMLVGGACKFALQFWE